MDPKRYIPQKILWLDLEMTGLAPDRDRILEVAAIITDWNFSELASFESGVGHDENEVRELVEGNQFFAAYPQNKAAFLELVRKSPSEEEVESQLTALIDQHFGPDEPVLLGGNSIHTDRQFIRRWWPQLESRLHYRMLDVSAWKVLMMAKFGLEFEKQESHRALDDIRESIAELNYYLHWFGAAK